MAEATARLLAWIEDSYPQAKTAMRSPAPQEAISAISRETHCDLPLSLETLWLAYDGEDAKKGAKLFNGYALMSTGEALEKVTSMCEVRETSTTDRWLPQWLPFAQDKGGDLLVVDLRKGEVFEWKGKHRARRWGETFDSFLGDYLARFDTGELLVDPEQGIVTGDPSAAPEPSSVRPVSTKKKLRGLAIFVTWLVVFAGAVAWYLRR